MVFVFGGFLAAGIPIIGAVASVAGALASLLGFSYLVEIDSSVVSILTVLGLGLSIDYGLLIVSRYREEARRPAWRPWPPEAPGAGHCGTATAQREQRVDALRRTMATAGRTVMFSGITVALSLSGLLLFEASILRAVGAAGLSVVVVALLVALTLVPALLTLLAGTGCCARASLRRVPGLRRLTAAFGDVPPEAGFFSALAALDAAAAVAGGAVGQRRAGAAGGARRWTCTLRSSGVELLPGRQRAARAVRDPRRGLPGPVGPRRHRRARLHRRGRGGADLASRRPRQVDGVERTCAPAQVSGASSRVVDVDLEVDDAVLGRGALAVTEELRGLDVGAETWVTAGRGVAGRLHRLAGGATPRWRSASSSWPRSSCCS